MKRILLAICALGMILTAQAQRVYINPGHGDWGSESRNMATVTHAIGDTTGFWESNTNLWKGFALNEKLQAAGLQTLMSRTENGPYPYVWGDESIDKPLLDLGEEAEWWGASHYISIHSNAGPTGEDGVNFANYPLYIYKGYDGEPSNWASEDMAYSSIMRLYEIFDDEDGPEPTTYYSPSNPNLRGSSSFYGYTLGALNHSIHGYLTEGYFHTYSPARHRALNPDWCRQEGVRYYRGIMDYYGYNGESVGYILGYVRSMTEMFSHAYYIPMPDRYDEFKPINNAKVVLRNAQGQVIKCNCYPYVDRMLKNQDYYTTDGNYNGVFMFENLQPGTYSISVHASGYQDYKSTITVYADKTVYPEIFLTPGQGTEPNIGGVEPDIKWQLNGGIVPGGYVPTNEQLWAEFMPYYNSFYGLNRAEQTIDKVSTFAPALMLKIMTDASSTYKWLGDYIVEVSASQNFTLSNDTTVAGIEALWRWSVHSFFNCNKHESYPITADFAEAGKPEKWGHAYQVATGSSAELPNLVTSTYTLPTPVKEGYDFVGWFDNANGTGTPITSIPAGWKGTLYAIWTEANVDVKWVLAGGTVAGNLPKEITGSPYTIPTPVKEGYIFLGWYDTNNTSGNKLTTLPVGYKGTVYAIWREAKVTWVLNGGKVLQEVTIIDVPTNEELWEDFKVYFNEYYEAERYDQPMENLTSFWPTDFDAEVKILLDQESEFAWLGHYIYDVVIGQGKEMGTEALWRWSLWAFFNCTQHTEYPVTADFTEAGKPEKWGPKYQEVHGGSSSTETQEVQLPSKIEGSPYTIPTPEKDNDTFIGWYTNNQGTGEKLTVLPVGYDGTVYAIWKSMTTSTDEAIVRPLLNTNEPMYDVLGRQVDKTYRGIILQNGHKYILR